MQIIQSFSQQIGFYQLNQKEKIMDKMIQKVRSFWIDESGATAVEYGMMVALIAAVIVISVQTLGLQIDGAFQTIVGAL